MKYYFSLQRSILFRKINAFGLNPFLGIFIGLFLFILFSLSLFSRVSYSGYIYVFLAFSVLLKLNELKRIRFIENLFSKKKFIQVRLIENGILSIPFLTILILHSCFIEAIILCLGSIIIVGFNFKTKLNYVIPTPFYSYPFEFLIGFRKTFYIFFLAFFLIFKAISVSNFNLGVFSLALIFITCLSFYSEIEPIYYVWIYSCSPQEFMYRKIKTGVLYYLLLSLPFSILLVLFFKSEMGVILILQVFFLIYFIISILVKYAIFSKTSGIPQVFLFLISIILPPLLIGLIPYFYTRSIKNLTPYLK